jgi:hypothetical protein
VPVASSTPLSVVVATIRGWPAAEAVVQSLRDQVGTVGGEIVIVDGSGKPAPSASDTGKFVRWISMPGSSVFQLREAGYRQTRGDIVAVTEDHCRATAGWVDAILRAHAEHPQAIAVGGAVENGTKDHAIDWAAFIVVQAPFVAPLVNGAADRIAGAPTVSYKRHALSRMRSHGSLGVIELFDTASIRREGETLVNDDRIRVVHHQSMGFWGTSAAEYHNGRTVAGFRRGSFARSDLLRVAAFPILPLYRSLRAIRTAFRKDIPPSAVIRAIPLVVYLQYAHGAGELLGYVAGPGDSPRRLL